MDTLTGMLSFDEYIAQAGVKGMKWGVRKAETVSTTHTSADAARVNKINKRISKNGLDNLSNDDIAKLNKRNQLMSEYKRNNPGTVKKGYKATKSALEVVGTATALIAIGTKVARSPLAQKGAQAVADVLKNL